MSENSITPASEPVDSSSPSAEPETAVFPRIAGEPPVIESPVAEPPAVQPFVVEPFVIEPFVIKPFVIDVEPPSGDPMPVAPTIPVPRAAADNSNLEPPTFETATLETATLETATFETATFETPNFETAAFDTRSFEPQPVASAPVMAEPATAASVAAADTGTIAVPATPAQSTSTPADPASVPAHPIPAHPEATPPPYPAQPTPAPAFPAAPGYPPASPTSAPAYPALAPTYPASAPAYPTFAPGYPTSAPAYPTSAPGYPTSAPAYPTSAPGYPVTAPYPAGPYPTAPYPYPAVPGSAVPYSGAGAPAQPWTVPGQRPPYGDVPPGGFPPYPGAPQPYAYPYPPFAAPVRKRRRWPLWTGLSVLLVVVLGVGAAIVAGELPGGRTLGSGGPASSPSMSPTPYRTPALPPPDPATLNGTLDLQSDALMRGDLKGFLAAIDPKATAAITEFTMIFHNMRAMKVARWSSESADGYVSPTATASPTEIDISYCLVVTACTSTNASLHVSQKLVAGHALISGVTVPKPTKDEYGPLPWMVSSLSAVTGPRVVVAASSAESSHLAEALPIAEDAVTNADRYALWGKPPVYVLYLASHSEGNDNWFGVGMKNLLGLSMPLDTTDIQVIVLMPDSTKFAYTGPGLLPSVIRHEFGHVATLQNDRYNSDDSFVEGIAQYIACSGHPTWDKYDKMAARLYIRSGRWSKKVLMTKEIRSSDLLTSDSAYEIGLLALRYLAGKYGQDKMLAFWGDVEQKGESPEIASTDVFHASWSSVNAAAVANIKQTVGA
jgi:hypothetical protein